MTTMTEPDELGYLLYLFISLHVFSRLCVRNAFENMTTAFPHTNYQQT